MKPNQSLDPMPLGKPQPTDQLERYAHFRKYLEYR